MSTNLTHAQAIETLKAGTVPYVEYRTKDATLSHWITVRCWLDSDGELVQSHPTDSQRGTCAAPTSVRYAVPSAEQLAEDDRWAAIQAENDAADALYEAEYYAALAAE